MHEMPQPPSLLTIQQMSELLYVYSLCHELSQPMVHGVNDQVSQVCRLPSP